MTQEAARKATATNPLNALPATKKPIIAASRSNPAPSGINR
jgi:hypothetical protein